MYTWEHQRILVENGLVVLPPKGSENPTPQQLATIMGNITHYGFALSESAYTQMAQADADWLAEWWAPLEQALKVITGADKKMADFVVYKNFPKEVLNMTEAEYWTKQILMYWGFPNEYFTEEVEERETAIEKLPVKVLQLANDDSLSNIFNSLLRSSVRWTDRQWETVKTILEEEESTDISSISFKENMVLLAQTLIEGGRKVAVRTATDVLRLAVGLSDGDVSLRTNSKLRRFCRPERRFLLTLLDGCKNIEEDMARRRGQFKRLFFELHPGDYKGMFKNVVAAYDKLYRGAKIKTFNSEIERLLMEQNPDALGLLKTRPGEFMRRLRVAMSAYGANAVEAFGEVLPRLTVYQLLKIERHLLTVNDRKYRVFPPRGNWTKLQVVKAGQRWDEELVFQLSEMVAAEVKERVSKVVPAVRLSADVDKVKLQGNDSDLTPYGRGTVFDIPDNITFLRSASYWKTGGGHYHNIWYDNGWNFFDDEWKSLGACCWTNTKFSNAAVFSGDPTNSKDLKGRACQMIDLYLDKLAKSGVRYAVWNVLCYSGISFDGTEEVHAALQWGEKPQKNKLFEPSRCVFSFPLRGANMTKYIAYIDVQERKLVYVDANLYGNTQSAARNADTLEEKMPAFVEYLNSLPSVFDLFKGVPVSDDGMPVLYEDSEEVIQEGKACVFMPRNKDNTFEQFDINTLLK
jgi:hypothetical protein